MKGDLRAIVGTLRMQMKTTFSRATFKFVVLVQPLVYATISYMMFRQSQNESFMAYVVLGTGLTTMWSSIVFSSSGDIERERYNGTLELISIAPVPLRTTIYGKIAGNTLLGLFSMIYSFLAVRIIYNVPIVIAHPLQFVTILFLSILALVGLGAVMAGCFTLSRNSRGLMNALEYPVFILSGVMFPIAVLPQWLHPVSYTLVMTWVVGGLRTSFGVPALPFSFGIIVAVLACFIVGHFLLANWLFRIIERQVRIKATLGVQ
ncbi:MAG: ABC transporter permease [Bacillota bacterium]|jgi:ABC-2 type transport system permease protein